MSIAGSPSGCCGGATGRKQGDPGISVGSRGNPLFQCASAGKPNSVAFWDNRCVQHRAMWDYWPHTRSGFRVTVAGDKPYLKEPTLCDLVSLRIPRQLPPGGGSMTECLIRFAQQVEALEFHGLWLTDAFGRGSTTLDPLSAMGVLCAGHQKRSSLAPASSRCRSATRSSTRIGSRRSTCCPADGSGWCRHRLDQGRLFDVVQADFDTRFKVLPGMLEVMRRTWNGEAVYGPALAVWPGTEGGPQMMLRRLRSPALDQSGGRSWMGVISSGIPANGKTTEIGLRMYREAGGKRAIVANIFC